jgi:hypothetical protein
MPDFCLQLVTNIHRVLEYKPRFGYRRPRSHVAALGESLLIRRSLSAG